MRSENEEDVENIEFELSRYIYDHGGAMEVYSST
jgi:hypothetical protein